MIKVTFGYYDDEDFGLTEYPDMKLINKDKNISDEEEIMENKRLEEYRKYLVTGIMEDFQYPESCDEILSEIKNLEKGKKFETEWDGQAFQHKITNHYVRFIHTVFGESEEYPVWTCRLKEYRKVLQVWKTFLELPKSIETKVEVSI